MTDLRFENLATTDDFKALMAAAGVRLPLNLSADDVGVIVDADGRDVLTVDVDPERNDEDVLRIALWIITAVNTCGGFRAGRPT